MPQAYFAINENRKEVFRLPTILAPSFKTRFIFLEICSFIAEKQKDADWYCMWDIVGSNDENFHLNFHKEGYKDITDEVYEGLKAEKGLIVDFNNIENIQRIDMSKKDEDKSLGYSQVR